MLIHHNDSAYKLSPRLRYHALDGLPTLLKGGAIVPFQEIAESHEIEAVYLALLGKLEGGTPKRRQQLKRPATENDSYLDIL